MNIIPIGPDVANELDSIILNRSAPDPGALAVGEMPPEGYLRSKRFRCRMISILPSATNAEVEYARLMEHQLDHIEINQDDFQMWTVQIMNQVDVFTAQMDQYSSQITQRLSNLDHLLIKASNSSCTLPQHRIELISNADGKLPSWIPETLADFTNASEEQIALLFQFYHLQDSSPPGQGQRTIHQRQLNSIANHLGLRL